MNEFFKPEILLDACAMRKIGVDGNAPMFAVFGKPISHSKSPQMQNAALKYLALKNDKECDAVSKYKNAKYFAFEVAPEDLASVLKLFYEKKFTGINLTIPHKELAMQCLGDFDFSAKLAGACNTLLHTENGWKGFNTDGFGLERAVLKNFGKEIGDCDCVVIGAGGAARGAAFHIGTLQKKGIGKTLTLVNRSKLRLEKLSQDLKSAGIANSALELSDENFYATIKPDSVIINATSVGLKREDQSVLDFSKIDKTCSFFDMPYIDGCETSSVKSASDFGLKAASGLDMLAWQGAKSLSIWTGEDVEALGEIMSNTLKKSKSIKE